MIDILLTDQPLSVPHALTIVETTTTGGINLFVGTVRDTTKGKHVLRLEFEAYAPMAEREMAKIATAAYEHWPLQRVAMHHRTGILAVGEIAVIIAVAAAHRDAAFAACRYCIDILKETVPIWKKEIFEDGSVWVNAHP
ncbi:MAG: molybdenum cofactor biosynthesis protein MoaE [Chitinophagia bacterium]|nr:molybdenum cofactor biosynthesis protein MoaE [Chitinophagia bacterium]